MSTTEDPHDLAPTSKKRSHAAEVREDRPLTPAVATVATPESTGHDLVQLELDGDKLRWVRSTHVDLPLPHLRGSSWQRAPWRYRALDPAGNVVAQGGQRDPRERHAPLGWEERDGDHSEHGQHVHMSTPVHFTVRVPASATTIELFERTPQSHSTPDLRHAAYRPLGSATRSPR